MTRRYAADAGHAFPMPRAFYRDARIEADFRASFCDLGEMQLRLYQIVEGSSPLADQLEATGEGMHHLCLHVPDLEGAIAELSASGVGTLWRCPESSTAYLETTHIGGMTFALAELS